MTSKLKFSQEKGYVQYGKIRIRIGYKSVLEEHWYFDTEHGSHAKEKFEATQEFKN